MKNQIDFSEIKDGDVFEDLVADYFRNLQQDSDNNISDVQILQSGIGVDGGRDILVEFNMNDDIEVFKRKWVVQCKFHEVNISAAKVNSVNIPTLVHSYGASGYLLVCKKNPTSGLTNLFERLNKECKNDYKYECWNGNQLKKKLNLRSDLHSTYFPEYNEWILKRTKR